MKEKRVPGKARILQRTTRIEFPVALVDLVYVCEMTHQSPGAWVVLEDSE